MPSLAIIGTGISGLGCAHFLQHDFDITVFEQNSYVGGHTNTVAATEPGTRRTLPIDTGFMVFNKITYPNLTRLFTELEVAIKPAEMSFSVRHADTGLEFAGSSLNHLFAQRRNLIRPRFWRMLSAIDRFNREAVQELDASTSAPETLADYVRRRGYGSDFLDLYLVPMSSAVWTTPPELMLQFPAKTLLRFFHNHGFLGLNTQHPWWTVDGGAKRYVDKLTAPWRDRIRVSEGAKRVVRTAGGVAITTVKGETHHFDKVILACHGDQALRLLAAPTFDEARLLGAFQYHPNVATLHTDASVMPRTKLAWSSWNYEVARDATGRPSTATHYWMNSLQGVSERENYFVTINRPESIAAGRIVRQINYDHPLFTLGAVRAQSELPQLNADARGATETYFAGAWQRFGFHEDGLQSALRVSELLLQRNPWDRSKVASLLPIRLPHAEPATVPA